MRTGGNKNSGFTIVETLIVIAVSGFLVISALVLISGRQNKTEFQVAINNLQQQIQQIINETSSGYFPGNGGFSCTIGGANQPVISPGTTQQGQNNGCILLGKVVQFGVTNGSSQEVAIYPLAGNMRGNKIKGLFASGGAQPMPVGPLVTNQTLQNGLTVYSMKYSTSPPPAIPSINTGAMGFLAGDNSGIFSSVDTNGNLNSGSQQLSLYAVNGTAISPLVTLSGTPPQDMAMITALSAPTGNNLVLATRVDICVASGGTNQSGLFSIGGNNSLAVSLTIHGNTICA